MAMPRDQLVQRLDEAIHDRKPAEPGDGSQARDGLRDAQYCGAAGRHAAIGLDDVQSGGQVARIDPRRDLGKLGGNPLKWDHPE
jgi:hypothetical protein